MASYKFVHDRWDMRPDIVEISFNPHANGKKHKKNIPRAIHHSNLESLFIVHQMDYKKALRWTSIYRLTFNYSRRPIDPAPGKIDMQRLDLLVNFGHFFIYHLGAVVTTKRCLFGLHLSRPKVDYFFRSSSTFNTACLYGSDSPGRGK